MSNKRLVVGGPFDVMSWKKSGIYNWKPRNHATKHKRYTDKGLEGLRDKPRSGKTTFGRQWFDDKNKKRIIEDSNTGWNFRQVIDIIQKMTGIKYHEVRIYRLLHKWDFVPKIPQKRFVRTAIMQEKKKFKKE